MSAGPTRRAGALLVLLALAGAPAARASADALSGGLPIPDVRSPKAWGEEQRAMYLNTAPIRRAREAIARGDDGAAESLLLEALANDPDDNRVRVTLVAVWERMKKYEEGIAMCDALLGDYPGYLDAYVRKGYMAENLGRTAEAIDALENLLAAAPPDDPRRRDVQDHLAELHFRAGSFERAETYGRLRLRHEGSLRNRLFVAECASRRGKWADAAEAFGAAADAADAEAERGDARLRQAYALHQAGLHEEAEQAFLAARDLLPGREKRLEVQKQLGLNAMILRKHEKAAGYFKGYLVEAFDEEVAAGHLDALLLAGRWDHARLEAAALLQRAGMSPALRERALAALMHAYRNLGDHPARLEAARELCRLHPSAPGYFLEAALAAELAGKADDAIAFYTGYLSLRFDPSAALSLHYLAKRESRPADAALLERILAAPDAEPVIRHQARYELAQARRAAGDGDSYARLMEALLKDRPEARFFREYAVQLSVQGHYRQAVETFARSIELEPEPAVNFATCKRIADLCLLQRSAREAVDWLNRGREFGVPDLEWDLGMARADYLLGHHAEVVRRLLPIAGDRDDLHLYIGYSFYKLGMPGLALLHLDRVSGSERLTPTERYNLRANLAYLHFDQGQYEAALDDVAGALGFRYTDDLALVRLKTLGRLGLHEDAVEECALLLEALDLGALPAAPAAADRLREPSGASAAEVRSAVCQIAGLSCFRLGRWEDAAGYFTRCIESEAPDLEALYLRGLARFKQGDHREAERDFLDYYGILDELAAGAGREAAPPASYWGDFGMLQRELGDHDLAAAALYATVEAHPCDVGALIESGYQLMKAHRNREAKASFRGAIDVLGDAAPHLEGREARAYRDARRDMKVEYAKLDKTWGAQAYMTRTEFDEDINTPFQTIEGALPSQLGVQASYRPPRIGFRNEKLFDVYGRVLANFKPNSFDVDEDSYQGAVGAVYKPLAARNFNVSLERLFKIGENSENNWLWRNMGAWERGEKPQRDKDFWMYSKAYTELSFFLDDPERWIYYLDGRLGLSLPMAAGTVLTFPQGLGVARYQSDDEEGLGTYAMLGLGANLRVYEREKAYVTQRWYVDAFSHYVWGWFDETPDTLDDRSFEGLIFGLSLVK